MLRIGVDARIAATAATVAGLIRPDPLADALATWDPKPWTVGLIGKIGSGKTTLWNRLTGGSATVGLGGVTREPARGEVSGAVVIDLPGIDAAEDFIAEHGAQIRDLDALVWVVDGLQPATASERAVLAALAPPELIVHAVVGRADLVDIEELGSVEQRVRAMRSGLESVITMDLRRDPLPAVFEHTRSSPRRVQACKDALHATHAALIALPPLLDERGVQEVVRTAFRKELRNVEELILEEIAAGRGDHRDLATRRFGKLAPSALTRAVDEVRAIGAVLPDGLPEPLRAPEPEKHSLWHDAMGLLSGGEGARRAVRAMAGRFALEGDLRIAEWAATGLPTDTLKRHRELAIRAVSESISSLS